METALLASQRGSTVNRWNPSQKVEQIVDLPVIWSQLGLMWGHCNELFTFCRYATSPHNFHIIHSSQLLQVDTPGRQIVNSCVWAAASWKPVVIITIDSSISPIMKIRTGLPGWFTKGHVDDCNRKYIPKARFKWDYCFLLGHVFASR